VSTPERRYRFPAKRYGWGWGSPTTWQGWVVLLAWLATMLPIGIWLAPRHPRLFWLFLVTMLITLLAVCYAKGEPPRWRWAAPAGAECSGSGGFARAEAARYSGLGRRRLAGHILGTPMLRHLVALLVVVLGSVVLAVSGEPVAKVTVASGAVLLDGKPTTLPVLDERLKALKAANGAVWYHRQNPDSEPPPQSTAVVQMIIKHQLPVTMSSKPDFLDYIDKDGVSRSRSR